MGQTVSQVQIQYYEPASLLGLPHEDRKALRESCCQLYNDIDEYIGPINCLNLRDNKLKQVYEFYERTFFSRIEISQRCLFDGFHDVLYQPHRIKSITLKNQFGIVTSNFLVELLEKAKGLTTLILNGIIKGQISRSGGPITLPKLKFLQLQISDKLYHIVPYNYVTFIQDIVEWFKSNPTLMETAMEMWWETQLALLSRLTLPSCQEIILELPQTRYRFDQEELSQAVLDFIGRHPSCRTLKVQCGCFGSSWPNRPPLMKHSFYYKRLKALWPNDPVHGPREIELPQTVIQIKELTFVTEVSVTTILGRNISRFMVSIEGLEKLNITSIRSCVVQWGLIIDLVQKNQQTLTELVINGTLSNRINPTFEVFTTCSQLKTLWIDLNIGFKLPISLRLSENITAVSLTALILIGRFNVENEELRRIPELVNLRYLAISGVGWDLEFDDFLAILRMRSLYGVIIPMMTIYSVLTDQTVFLSKDAQEIYLNLFPFLLEESMEFFISDWVTPWWKRLDDGTVEYHEPGRIINI